MRIQCPQCRTTLELAQAPPAGAKIQCGQCGARFGVATPSEPTVVKPVVLPRTPVRPTTGDTQVGSTIRTVARPPGPLPTAVPMPGGAIPVASLEPPVAALEEPGGGFDDFPKKKRKKRRRYDSDDSGMGAAVAKIIGVIVFVGLILGGGIWGLSKGGLFGRRSLIQFNDELVGHVNRFQMASLPLQNQMGFANPDQAMNAIASLRQPLATALEGVRKITPPPEGKEFYDAVMRFLERCDKYLNTEIPQAESLLRKGRQNEAGQIILQGAEEIQELENNYMRVQKEFAKKHGFKILQPNVPGQPQGRGRFR